MHDTAVEADSPDQAVELAKNLCQHDPANWAAEGSAHRVSVDPDPTQTLPDYSDVLLDELMDAIMVDISADIYYTGDDEDDGSEAPVSA